MNFYLNLFFVLLVGERLKEKYANEAGSIDLFMLLLRNGKYYDNWMLGWQNR